MILLKNITKYYEINKDKLYVLNKVNLHIQEKEMVAITGVSGSGKSTLLNIIGILDKYNSGTLQINNKFIENLTEEEEAFLRNQFIGFIFQSFHLIDYKTALENVELPLIYRRIPRKKRQTIASFYLEKVGLADRMNHTPSEMSGGQKQRVAIARALATDPAIIIADEPTGALDSKTSQEVLGLLMDLNKEGKTVIIVTHDEHIAQKCQRIIRLEDGVIIEDNYLKII